MKFHKNVRKKKINHNQSEVIRKDEYLIQVQWF